MALQIRRGTDVDRQGITPKAGEPIFTTDTNKLYIGDGTTAGGLIVDTTSGISNVVEDTSPQLGANLDLNNSDITGTGNISITGAITATSVNITGTTNLKGSVFADDSTILVDGVNGIIPASVISGTLSNNLTGNVVGNLTGGVTGNVTGNLTGDVTGNITSVGANVFSGTINMTGCNVTGAQFSLVGNTQGTHTGNVIGDVTGYLNGIVQGSLEGDMTGSVFSNDSTLVFSGDTLALSNITTADVEALTAKSGTFTNFTTYNQGHVFIKRTLSSGTISDNRSYGNLDWTKSDDGGALTPVRLTGAQNYFRIVNDSGGISTSSAESTHLSWFNNKLGVGYRSPAGSEALQVNGDVSVAGYIANDQIKIQGNEIATTVSNANLELTANGTGTVQLTVPTQATVGSAGGAAAVPAQPSTYFKINIGGTDYVVPAFAVS